MPAGSRKGRGDERGVDLAAGHAHPHQQVVLAVGEGELPERKLAAALPQLPEKRGGETFFASGAWGPG